MLPFLPPLLLSLHHSVCFHPSPPLRCLTLHHLPSSFLPFPTPLPLTPPLYFLFTHCYCKSIRPQLTPLFSISVSVLSSPLISVHPSSSSSFLFSSLFPFFTTCLPLISSFSLLLWLLLLHPSLLHIALSPDFSCGFVHQSHKVKSGSRFKSRCKRSSLAQSCPPLPAAMWGSPLR